jgi:hypothetical protein
MIASYASALGYSSIGARSSARSFLWSQPLRALQVLLLDQLLTTADLLLSYFVLQARFDSQTVDMTNAESTNPLLVEQMGRAKMVLTINEFLITQFMYSPASPTCRDAASMFLEAARFRSVLILLPHFFPAPAAPVSTLVLLFGGDDKLASLLDRCWSGWGSRPGSAFTEMLLDRC